MSLEGCRGDEDSLLLPLLSLDFFFLMAFVGRGLGSTFC